MLFDERAIQYFQTIANERNISRAAQKLYITQPSLSRFLSRLEKQLGGELFERRVNQLVLTTLGECFLQYIQEAQQLSSRYERRFAELLCQENQVLRIGAGTTTGPYLTRGVFPRFQQEYPNIRLQLVEDIHINLLQKLDRKQVDLALLVYNGSELAALERDGADLIIQQNRLLVVGVQHPLAALVRRPEENSIFAPQPISPEMLEGQTFITGVPGQKIWEDIQLLQRKYSLKGLHFISSQSVDTSLSMAACGMGIYTFPPFYMVRSQVVQQGGLYYFLLDDPLLQWVLAMRYSSRTPGAPEKWIAELTRETFQMEAESGEQMGRNGF